jgi:hypothetical protein
VEGGVLPEVNLSITVHIEYPHQLRSVTQNAVSLRRQVARARLHDWSNLNGKVNAQPNATHCDIGELVRGNGTAAIPIYTVEPLLELEQLLLLYLIIVR